uniref:Uncharacterized protein n=1 Tax=Cacopsylla melanoneura TaxID=428564 RepID=A0A8D9E765_9HEMI
MLTNLDFFTVMSGILNERGEKENVKLDMKFQAFFLTLSVSISFFLFFYPSLSLLLSPLPVFSLFFFCFRPRTYYRFVYRVFRMLLLIFESSLTGCFKCFCNIREFFRKWHCAKIV